VSVTEILQVQKCVPASDPHGSNRKKASKRTLFVHGIPTNHNIAGRETRSEPRNHERKLGNLNANVTRKLLAAPAPAQRAAGLLANGPSSPKPSSTGRPTTGLLVSARSVDEALLVLQHDNVWLDLKEPSAGSLGRPSIETIEDFLSLTHSNPAPTSIAAGELVQWTDDLSTNLVAKLPSHCFIKFGLSNAKPGWADTLNQIGKTLHRRQQMILVHYADSEAAQCPDWIQTLRTAETLECRYVLVDTYDKSGGGLLDHLSIERLASMIQIANAKNLAVALAGSLQANQLASLMNVGAAWLGFRGAVCENRERTSTLCKNKLQSLCSEFTNHVMNDHHSRNES
jgi:(5-formylfuran-3-yl)methyl phosphate synthase